MRASVGGHVGGLQLSKLLDLAHRTAYRPLHVAFTRVGVPGTLPPDVATVMAGEPHDGLWWNLRRGIVPEEDVRTKAGEVDNTEVLELMHKYGMNPLANAMRQGIAKRPDAQRLISERHFKQRVPSKLIYSGWRKALTSMLVNRAIRGSSEAERLLGTKDYRAAMIHRRLRDTVHYDEGF